MAQSLYQQGYISFEQGLRYSTSPDNFRLRVQGIQSTTDLAMEDMEKKMSRTSGAKTPPAAEEA